ncbi:MAG TPA: hypothetical protein VJR89_30720, partial [Polyangiales bacterium]|nr:hypothetical protein [Polyangiales bacterium]
ATVADGSAAFYNCAGLAHVERNRLDVSAAAYGLRFYSVQSFLAVRGGPAADSSVTEFVAVPTSIAYVRELSPTLMLGLGYFVPRAGNALLSDRLTARTESGTRSLWSVDARVTSASSWLVAALGVRLSERVRFGFGLYGIYENEASSTTLFGQIGAGEMPSTALEYATLGQATRISGAPGAGLQLELGHGVTLGLAARGPQLQLISSASESINFVLGNVDPQLLGTQSNRESSAGDQFGFIALGRYSAGVAYRAGPAQVSAELDVQPGLQDEDLLVDRVFTFNARAGFTYALGERVTFGAGAFSDRAADSARSDAKIHFYGATLGIKLEDVLGLAANERTSTLILSSVFALRYAYGSGRADTFLADTDGELENIVGTAAHGQHVHELALHIGSGLHF